MAGIRLTPGTRYQLDGHVFEIKRILFGGNIEVEDLGYGIVDVTSDEKIRNAFFDGKLRFEVKGRNKIKNSKLLPTEYKWGDFNLIPEKYRQKAWERYLIIKEILSIPDEKRTKEKMRKFIIKVIDEMNQKDNKKRKYPGIVTVYRWLKFYKESNENICSLIPDEISRGGKGRSRLVSEVDNIVESEINSKYMTMERPTCQEVWESIVNRIGEENKFRSSVDKLEPPAYETVWSRINKLDPYEAMAARYGKRKADQEFGNIKSGIKTERILERAEIDHTCFDQFLVDIDDRLPIGRPVLTYVLDRYSGYPLGFYLGFEPPSYLSVMNCLIHAITPKTYVKDLYPDVRNNWDAWGLMDELVVDNGKEFIGKDLEFACAQLGISIQQNKVATPWFKAGIERHFRTINQQLLNNKPGKTFSNLFDRKDYDPAKNAVISINEFLHILHIWIIDYYTQRFNKGIKGVPAKLWSTSIQSSPPSYPPNKEDLRVLLSRVEYRYIRRQGIELFGLNFNDPYQLSVLRSAAKHPDNSKDKFLIKYDPSNLSNIYVYDHIYKKSYIEIPAVDQEYTEGLTLWKHKIICELARKEKKEVDIFALANAKARIQNIVDMEWSETKKVRTRKNLARFKQIGSPMILGYEGGCSENKEVSIQALQILTTGEDPYKNISDLNALNVDELQAKQNKKIELLTENESIEKRSKVVSNKRKNKQEENVKSENDNINGEYENDLDISDWEVSYSL